MADVPRKVLQRHASSLWLCGNYSSAATTGSARAVGLHCQSATRAARRIQSQGHAVSILVPLAEHAQKSCFAQVFLLPQGLRFFLRDRLQHHEARLGQAVDCSGF